MILILTMLIILFAVTSSIYILVTEPKLRYRKISDFFIGVVLVILFTLEIPLVLYIIYLIMPTWSIGSLFFLYLFYFYSSLGIIQIFYIAPLAILFAQRRHWQKMAGVIAGAISTVIILIILSTYYPLNL